MSESIPQTFTGIFFAILGEVIKAGRFGVCSKSIFPRLACSQIFLLQWNGCSRNFLSQQFTAVKQCQNFAEIHF